MNGCLPVVQEVTMNSSILNKVAITVQQYEGIRHLKNSNVPHMKAKPLLKIMNSALSATTLW